MSKFYNLFIPLFFLNFLPIISYQDYKCGETIKNIKVGQDVILCIHILSKNKKLAMRIKVDEYSMVSFNNIYKEISNPASEIEFVAQIGDIISTMPTVSIYNIFILFSYIIMNRSVLIC